jgi:hypothetical protein
MLSSRTLAFILATATSSLALAAPPARVPFVPSTVQRPDSHAGRYGLVTIVTYGLYGQKTTSTQIIDLDTYIRSGAKTMLVGQAAANQAEANGICLVPDPIDGGCAVSGSGSVGGDAGAGSGTGSGTGDGGTGPNINPNGSGPGTGAPEPPDPPNPTSVPWSVGVVTYTQYYDNGQWEQTTTYSRNVYPATQSDGSWGNPVTSISQVKH